VKRKKLIMAEQKSWNLKMTEFAKRTENPLRKIWEGPRIEPNSEKEAIKFQIGKIFDSK
jgi:hypothetical protein